MPQLNSFAEFWPYYVRAHSRTPTRILHAIGSIAALACVAFAITTDAWLFLAAPVIGYSFAWYAHFFVEHNKPATFGHPFWSLAADYVMLFKMLTGRMGEDVRKYATP
jgi:hypothetical protein